MQEPHAVWNAINRSCPTRNAVASCHAQTLRCTASAVALQHKRILVGLLAILVPALCFINSAQAAVSPDSSQPLSVTVGAYILGLGDVDLRQGTCVADLWIWFRWRPDGSDFDPLENLELINGQIEESTGEVHKTLDDGQAYAAKRIRAVLHQQWDVTSFPLDSQAIRIACEDAELETHALVYQVDSANSGLAPNVAVPGWTIFGRSFEVAIHAYSTNYGDTSLPTGSVSEYSRFTASFNIIRPGFGLFVKLFAGLFAAVAIALLALFICPTHVDPRFGLPVGAMFAAIASQYVIASVLPESTEFTLADTLHVTSFTGIVLVLVESVMSLALYSSGRVRASRLLDRSALALLVVGFLARVVLATRL
jgi:hypothetical protein